MSNHYWYWGIVEIYIFLSGVWTFYKLSTRVHFALFHTHTHILFLSYEILLSLNKYIDIKVPHRSSKRSIKKYFSVCFIFQGIVEMMRYKNVWLGRILHNNHTTWKCMHVQSCEQKNHLSKYLGTTRPREKKKKLKTGKSFRRM